MIIDTHMHESKYSLDSFISLKEIVFRAKSIGLNGICITDHESNEIKEESKILSKKEKFPIIVGAEFLTFEGDILVFGLDKLPDKKVSAQKLIEVVEEVGGVAIAAHPYRKNNRGLENKIRTVKGLHGVECFNGSTPMNLNLMAYNDAEFRGAAMLGGSDCHEIDKVGVYSTHFPDGIESVEDLIWAIRNRKTSPVVYENGCYTNINKYIRKAI